MNSPDDHPPTAHTGPTAPPTSPYGFCPKCRGAMEHGLAVDGAKENPIAMRGYERALQWVRGRPEKRFWDQSFSTAPEDRLNVATLRCTACGYLEFYARGQ